MKRKMGTDEDRQKVARLLNTEKEGWRVERLIDLNMGLSLENTLAEFSEVICRGWIRSSANASSDTT